jgi:hypothetical protein
MKRIEVWFESLALSQLLKQLSDLTAFGRSLKKALPILFKPSYGCDAVKAYFANKTAKTAAILHFSAGNRAFANREGPYWVATATTASRC